MQESLKKIQNEDICPVKIMLIIEYLMYSIEYFKEKDLVKNTKQIALSSFKKLIKEAGNFNSENKLGLTKKEFIGRIKKDIKKYNL